MAAELPIAGGTAFERRDATRNRERVLAAAAELIARDGVACVDVRDVASCAGVGVGTIYRRFGDKGRLVAALLDETERELQERVLTGPPPLGPGAPAAERLGAFLDVFADHVVEHLDLLLAAEGSAPGARYRVGAYAAWRFHLVILLHELDPDLDADWFAEALLAPLAADLLAHQDRERGLDPARLKRNLARLVATLA